MQNIPWDKLEKVFEAVAEVIRKGGEHFWPLVVRQQIIGGSFYLAGALALIVTGLIWIRWCWRRAKEDTYDEELYTVGIGIAIVVLAIIVPILLFYAVSLLFNPEWWALKALIELVK